MQWSTNESLTRLFRRVTTSGNFIAEVDGLRFLALAGVLVQHTYANYNRVVPEGKLSGFFPKDGLIDIAFMTAGRGVELFFIISGFILAMPFVKQYLHEGKPVSIGKYFLRRLTRLEPPYIVAMLLCFAAKVLSGEPPDAGAPSYVASLLASLGYVHNIVYQHNSYINGVAWSLEVEVQFYILAPVLAALILTRSLRTRTILYATVFFAAPVAQDLMEVYFGYPVESSRKNLLGTFQFFVMGFALAELHMARIACPVKGIAAVGLGIALLCAMFLVPVRESFVGSRMLFLGAAVVFYWLVISPGFWQELFRTTPIVLIGGMCYTIYLVHFPMLVVFSRLAKRIYVTDQFIPNYIVHFLLVIAPILICSAVFYLLVEKPCMNPNWPSDLRKRIFGNSPSAAKLANLGEVGASESSSGTE